MKDTIEKLGYIYVAIDNGDGIKLQREEIESTCEMGNNFVVHTKRFGVVVFKKNKEVIRDEYTFYLTSTHIPQLEKRQFNKYYSLREDIQLDIENLNNEIREHEKQLAWYDNKIEEGYQSRFLDLEKYIDEDKEKLVSINKELKE